MSQDNVLVLAIFDNEASADEAVAALKSWDKANELVKLGGIGVLVKDENGKIKEHKLGPHQGKKGAGVGLVLGIVAAIPTGGLSLVGGMATGAIGGGVVGSFFHKGFHELKKEDADRIDQELNAGRAAVGVLVEPVDADVVTAQLVKHGGTPEKLSISDDTLKDAAEKTGVTAEPMQPPQGTGQSTTPPA